MQQKKATIPLWKVTWEKRVYINGAQYFEGIEKGVWTYQIGGYQVMDKWLKDRKGRPLSYEEILFTTAKSPPPSKKPLNSKTRLIYSIPMPKNQHYLKLDKSYLI